MSRAFFEMAPEGAFEPRPGGGMRLHGGKGSSAPPPDPALIQAHIKSLGVQDKAIEEVLANARRLQPLQDEQMQFGLKTARTAYDQSQQDRQWFLGQRDRLTKAQNDISDYATTFDTEDRREQLAGQAIADVNQAFGIQQQALQRNMTRMGVNPNDGKFAAMSNQNAIAAAAAQANAANKTREAALLEGLQLKTGVANMMQGYPAQSMAATSAGAGFGGLGLSTVNTGLAGMNSGWGAAGQMAGQWGGSAINGFNAQANYKNTQDQIAASSDPTNTILGAVTGVATGAALKSMGVSDLRLKESITAAGTDERTGLPLYEFEYKGGTGKRFRGVMAQDVMHVDPEAVFVMPDGFMAVNYSRLGMEMVEV